MSGILGVGSKSGIINSTVIPDGYEEGSWSPYITTTGTDYTTTGRGQDGSYVKIGKMITVTGNPSINTPSGGSGNLIITGLPFPASYYNGETTISFGRVTLGQSGAENYLTQLEPGESKINFFYSVSQAGVNAMPHTVMHNATPYVAFTMTYFIE